MEKSGSLPSEVWMMSFGFPTLYNVIGYDEETDQYHLQVEGYFGSRYRKVSDAMTIEEVHKIFQWHQRQSDFKVAVLHKIPK